MPSQKSWGRRRWFWIEFAIMTGISIGLAHIPAVDKALKSFFSDRRSVIYPALVGLEGTILGFVIAALTIVLGYANSPRFDILRESKHWAPIFEAFTNGSRWTAGAVCYAIAGTLFDRDKTPISALTLAVLLSAILAAARIARVLYITEGVVKVVISAKPRAAGE